MRKIWKSLLFVLLSVFLLAGCAETDCIEESEPMPTPELMETPAPEASPEPRIIPNAPESLQTTAAGHIVVPNDPTDLIRFLETFDFDTVVVTNNNTGEQEVSIFPSVNTIIRLELFYEVSGIYFDAFELRTEQTAPLLFTAYLALDEDQKIQFYQLIAESEA